MIDPHAGQPVVSAGLPLSDAHAVVILIHGRGAAPQSILELVPRLDRGQLAFLAPAAAGGTWYPLSFLADREKNEPFLSSALRRIDAIVAELISAGTPPNRIILMGFSQGACLATEFVYRHPRPYGGLVAFSGGLVGPPGTTWTATADFGGTAVFLGCSDVDPHVPQSRVAETAAVFARLGAEVIERIYPGMGHLVSDDEIVHAQKVIDRLLTIPAV